MKSLAGRPHNARSGAERTMQTFCRARRCEILGIVDRYADARAVVLAITSEWEDRNEEEHKGIVCHACMRDERWHWTCEEDRHSCGPKSRRSDPRPISRQLHSSRSDKVMCMIPAQLENVTLFYSDVPQSAHLGRRRPGKWKEGKTKNSAIWWAWIERKGNGRLTAVQWPVVIAFGSIWCRFCAVGNVP